jgi:hypothetical protein
VRPIDQKASFGTFSIGVLLQQKDLFDRKNFRRKLDDMATLSPRFRYMDPHPITQIELYFLWISDGIIAGHGRVGAAKLIGMSDVPTARVDHLSPLRSAPTLSRTTNLPGMPPGIESS